VNQADFSNVAEKLIGGVGPVTRALGGIFGGFGTAFLIMILGIYFVLEPDLYQRGIAWMLPAKAANISTALAHRMGTTLRGCCCRPADRHGGGRRGDLGVARPYGVPMAAPLGLLVGLLAALPNIGAPISGILMVLVGFSGGTDMGIFTIVYVVVQAVDGNISAMVAKKTADSPRRWCWARS
jgi:predicted PurR-regulated permease PerM